MRNRRRSSRRGFTLIEMMVAGLVSVLLGAAVLSLLRASYDDQYMLMNQNMVNTTTRQTIDTFADNLRGSQGLTAADGSSLTYTDASGQPVRYWKSGTSLMKTVNGLPAGGAAAVQNVSAVSFVYWTWNGTSWTSATSSTSPSTVSAVDFAVTLTQNGSTRTISGSVKIRQK
jgi:prepilin-type N-terminal cleavage/methylation domain-containing protein